MNSMKNSKSLFIVSSPFQAVCAVEAVYEYRIQNPVFIILLGSQSGQNSNTLKILHSNNFKNIYELFFSSFFDIFFRSNKYISNYRLNLDSYDIVFVGDYLNPVQRFFSTKFLLFKNKIIFLDDGNATIEVFKWGNIPTKIRSLNLFIKTTLSDIVFLLKKKRPIEYFTIFNYQSSKFKIKINNLNYLKSKISVKSKNGVYILGSNIYNKNLLSYYHYEMQFEEIINHVRDNYPAEPIYYCYHRGEPTEFVELLTSKYNIQKYLSDFTIEIDMVQKNIYPEAIYSFGSTASYSLKIIYPNINSYSILLRTNSKSLNKSYKLINEVYSDNGIQIFNL